MKKAGTVNPVMMLDEIDKLGADFRGDPSAALLEVLDPEQNHSFSDHYLDLAYDLSKIMFIATANLLDPIPGPLRDRMEILELPGYTFEEKVHIALNHLIPKQLKEHGLSPDAIAITEKALIVIIMSYTREAGVRNLERRIADVCRAVAVEVASGKIGAGAKREIHEADIEGMLGPEKFYNETAERTEIPGVATGLAWTAAGGDILFIEATKMTGKGSLTLTGQLGDVMKESAQAALSYLRSKSDALGIAPNFLEKTDLHIHFPAGSIPKDGPSAGVTILTALVSLLTGNRVRSDVAMTGEVTLRGLVLPVGGIKEKVLAAHRAGIKRIIIPARNEKDLIDVPDQARKELEFVYAAHMDEVLAAALEENPVGRKPPAPPEGEGKQPPPPVPPPVPKPGEVRV
jgi:ATP-dependent Lon protease